MSDVSGAALEDAVLTAIELSGAEREEFLARLRAENPDLHARVTRLVARHDHSRGLLSTPPSEGFVPPDFDPDRDALEGRWLGDFRLDRLIGLGGWGRVYEATQRAPERRVAVKVLTGPALRSQSLRRFAREAQVLATLEHPGICRVLHAGSARLGPDTVHFIAMDLVEGEPLCQASARLSVPARIELIAKVCDAVAHAHGRGVIHRDLKPANVLVVGAAGSTPDGDGPRPKVVDFGIAHMIGREGTAITMAGSNVAGTLEYMSPEQFADAAPDADARSDVYAIGVMLFEVLAGKRPFERPSAAATAANVLAARAAAPLSSVMPSFDASDAGELDAIVARAIEPNLDRRYASAAELAADLRSFLGRDRRTRPTGTGRRVSAARVVRRHRAWLVGLLVLGSAASIYGLARSMPVLWGLSGRGAVNATTSWASYVAAIDTAKAAVRVGDYAGAARALDGAPAEHRAWEWRYLSALTRSGGTSNWSTGGVFKFHQETMVAWGSGELYRRDVVKDSIHVLDRVTLNVRATVPNIVWDRVFRLGTTRDGRWLVAATDGLVRCYDTATGAMVAERAGFRNEDRGFETSPDSRTVALAGETGQVRILSLPSLETAAQISDMPTIFGLRFAPDGESIYLQCDGQLLRRRSIRDGSLLWKGAEPEALQADWPVPSPDGKYVYFLTYADRMLNAAEASTGRLIRRTPISPAPRILLALPDGKRVLVGCEDGTFMLYPGVGEAPPALPWLPIFSQREVESPVNTASVSSDGRQIFLDMATDADLIFDAGPP